MSNQTGLTWGYGEVVNIDKINGSQTLLELLI